MSQLKNENNQNVAEATRPAYEPPAIRVMTESEVLSAFQVTAAGTSMWWVA